MAIFHVNCNRTVSWEDENYFCLLRECVEWVILIELSIK